MQTLNAVCKHCGSDFDYFEDDMGKSVLCKSCFKPNRIQTFAESMQVEAPEDCQIRGAHDDFFFGGGHESPAASVSHETPAAAPTQAKDPDKALTNVALGIVRLNNWPCQEDPGYRSFTARVKFRSSQLGCTTTDDFRISAEDGLLIFESPVIELPDLPGIPLLETLNEINQRSVSAVFSLQDQVVTIRHALIPLTREEGFLNAGMILQTLRQMNHDRRHGLSLIREVVEKGRVEPLDIARAFAQPMAPSKVGSPTLEQAADLAGFAGYAAHNTGGQLVLGREHVRMDKCMVKIAVCPGFIRSWVTLGDSSNGKYVWTFVPPSLRELFNGEKTGSSGKLTQLYVRLNELNQHAGLVRFVVTQKNVVATSTYFCTQQPMSVEQFQVYAEALLRHTVNMTADMPYPPHRMAV